MIKTKLFEGKITTNQALIVGAWYANLLFILALWAITSASLLTSGSLGSILIGFGRLLGLLAAYFALTQFLLMGRIRWIESPFGLDHLASYHRLNGYFAIYSMLIHVPLVVLGYALLSETNVLAQYFDIVRNFPYVNLAAISLLLFIAVVISSIYIVRRKLKFETWYYVHLITYAAIVLAFFHQVAVGGSFLEQAWARNYWYALYAFVAFNVLYFRFGVPTINLVRFGFKVSRLETETATTTSVYIGGRNLQKWGALPGQYVLVRFLSKGFIFQEHPFSLSALPKNDVFRLTIRNIGDYTSKIPALKPGSRVLVSGPFGRFTPAVAQTNKRLFIAGGVGITPLRTLIEASIAEKQSCVLLYANRTTDDVIFEKELESFTAKGLTIFRVFSDPQPGFTGETGYIDADRVKRLVPDFAERDVYVCGPPPMMDGIITGLRETALPAEQLHFEKFALHN